MNAIHEISIKTPRGDIFGKTSGPQTGPVVLGIHGWNRHNGWHTWRVMLAPLAAAGFRVITVDMPGWGASPKWERTAGKSAVVAILDSLEVGTAAAIMGKSWGGGVAVDTAVHFPDRVEKLILTAPAVRDPVLTAERLTKPVLMAWAVNDSTIPIQMGRELARMMSHLELVEYAEGEHEAAQHNVEEFAPRAIKFLQS